MATIAGLTEDFAGGAPGATVTSANTIFNDVDNSVGAVPGTFNDDAYLPGLQSMNVSTNGTSSSHRVDHDPAGGWRVFGFRLLTVDTTSATALSNWFSGALKGGDFREMTDRTVQLRNQSSNAWVSPVLSTATWYTAAIRVAPTLHCKIYRDGALIAGGDSGPLTASNSSTYNLFRLGRLSTSTGQTRFARLRGDTTTEPGSGITPAASVTYTRRDLVEIDTAGSVGTMTLTQTAGAAATITGPTSGVFEVEPPPGHSDVLTFDLTATDGPSNATQVITVEPGGTANAVGPLVFDGDTWEGIAPVSNTPSYDGWDPTTNTAPAERSATAYYTNTGLFLQSDRDRLVQAAVSADLTTTATNQVFDGQDFINDVIVAHSGVVFKRCRFRKGIDCGPLGSGDVAPVVIYSDFIHNNGVASTSIKNMVSGPAKLYRCNCSGYVDGMAIKTAADNNGQRGLFLDCFLHDLRLVDDPGQPGRSHNDWFQSNQTGGACDFTHCTIFGSATNNFSAVESWTRSSGPHWTAGATPKACTFDNPASGGDPVGRINAVIQLQSGTSSECDLYRNLIAGSMFRVTNATTGNVVRAVDNEVASEHMDSGNPAFGGTLTLETGNVNWLTGAPVS